MARSNLKLHLVCLTGEIDHATDALLRACGDDREVRSRIHVLTVPSAELVYVLCAADIGLLLRHSVETNRVAFPNKIDEYLAAGLGIVTTLGLPAAAELVNSCAISGVVLETPQLRLAHDYIRNTCSDSGCAKDRWRRANVARARHSFTACLQPFVTWAAAVEAS
jgi:hypothetical protein